MPDTQLDQSRSSILLVGPFDHVRSEFGAEACNDLGQANTFITGHAYSILVIAMSFDSKKILELASAAKSINPNVQLVLVHEKQDSNSLQDILGAAEVFKVIPLDQPEILAAAIYAGLENHNRLEQQDNLHKLFNEQNEKLLVLKNDLEDRVNKRELNLNKAKRKLVATNHRIQAMHEALIALNKATSLSNMETLLNKSLAEAFGLVWIRIVFAHQTELIEALEKSEDSKSVLSVPLYINADHIGHCFFARSKEKKFLKDEKDFLGQISETISIAIDRISKKEMTEKLRGQWVTTFNAISDPICITNDQFQIVQTNQSFLGLNIKGTKANTGLNAFEVFFGNEAGKKISQAIDNDPLEWERVDEESDTTEFFQISAHPIHLPDTFEKRKVLIFHNVTNKKQLERQVIESSKLAELGTISSSIAHELNNPLGGMLNFLQLIKMDLKEDAAEKDDVDAMIDAGMKCKEIIENLLGFSRRTYFDIDDNLSIAKVIEKALQLSKLQSKYQNINIQIASIDPKLIVQGDENQLIQALRNILQNSVEAIADQAESTPDFQGEIRIEALPNKNNIDITISDNGPGADRNLQRQFINPLFTTKDTSRHSGLGLTIAHQIIEQHGGKLEIFSQPNAGTVVKLHLIQSRFEGQETSF